jgi:translocation and assembly module TamA
MPRGCDVSVPARRRAAVAPAVRVAAALGLLLLAGCLRARGTPEEPVVVAVDLEGVKAVDADELKEKLATKASDRFAWGEARRLDPDALAYDRRRIVAFYKQRGYYRAAVEAVDERPEGEGRVRVVIRIREGEPVRVARVEIEGLDAVPEAREQAGALAIEQGKVFTWAAYDAARAQLQAALLATGWALGQVTPTAFVRAEEGTADVVYRVEPGPRFRFGAVTVTGTEDVPKGKIEARAERQVRPGDWYDERKLERIQSRVFELGVFSAVRVGRGTPEPEAGTLPVNVTVREAPFHTVRLGPGIGFDPTRWEVIGQASWVHRNWLGDLRRLKLDARAGYAWIPNPFSPIREGVVGTLAAEFSQPGVLGGDLVDLTTKVELEKSLEQAYGATSEKFRIGTPIRPAPRWTFVPSYNLEIYQLRDLGGNPSDIPIQNCPSQLCVLSYLEQRISWDGRDNPLLTTEGLYLSLGVQEGFPAGGVGYTYLRFVPEVRAFYPLGRGTVLAMRALFGAIVPVNETGPAPIVALFTSGGAGSMRGYGSERLSPMAFQDGEWVPTGGNGVVEGSLELRRNFVGSLEGAVFLDVGNVSTASGSPSQWREILDLSKLQLALGFGIRYRTPVGPFRADLGVRLPNDLSKGVPFQERFPAVPGDSGHREPIAVVHVALGEAF